MNLVVLVGWLFLRIDSATATYCLSCAPMRSSVPCFNTTNCPRGQECYAKYVMKPDGTVMYEFGCQNSQSCPAGANDIIGQRLTGDTDLCHKCCHGDMCNQGNLCSVITSTASTTTHALQTNTDLCSGNPCMHGNCFSGSADYLCLCDQGWQGKNCDQHQNQCSSNPCMHRNCFSSSADYVCKCEQGWQGENCDQPTTSTTLAFTTISTTTAHTTPANLCFPSPCIHGSCHISSANPPTFFCQCPTGFEGVHCETRQSLCARGPCVHGNCFESSIDYVCHCENQWTGKNCDQGTAVPPHVLSRCPDNWMTFKGSCFFFHRTNQSFTDAQHACLQRNSNLVQIDSEEENQFIKNLLKHESPLSRWWLGLSDEDIEGIWKWVGSGDRPTYIDWYPGEPNNVNNEDCAIYRWVEYHNNFNWQDFACSDLYYSICALRSEISESIIVG